MRCHGSQCHVAICTSVICWSTGSARRCAMAHSVMWSYYIPCSLGRLGAQGEVLLAVPCHHTHLILPRSTRSTRGGVMARSATWQYVPRSSVGRPGVQGDVLWLAVSCGHIISHVSLGRPGAQGEVLLAVSCDLICVITTHSILRSQSTEGTWGG